MCKTAGDVLAVVRGARIRIVPDAELACVMASRAIDGGVAQMFAGAIAHLRIVAILAGRWTTVRPMAVRAKQVIVSDGSDLLFDHFKPMLAFVTMGT